MQLEVLVEQQELEAREGPEARGEAVDQELEAMEQWEASEALEGQEGLFMQAVSLEVRQEQ